MSRKELGNNSFESEINNNELTDELNISSNNDLIDESEVNPGISKKTLEDVEEEISKKMETILESDDEEKKKALADSIDEIDGLVKSGELIFSDSSELALNKINELKEKAYQELNDRLDAIIASDQTTAQKEEKIVRTVADESKGFLGSILSFADNISSTIENAFKDVAQKANEVIDTAVDSFTELSKGTLSFATEVVESHTDLAMNVIAEIGGCFSSDFKEQVKEAADYNYSENVEKVIDAVCDGAAIGVETICDIGEQVIDKVVDAASEAREIAKDAGYEIVKGTVEGLEGVVDTGLTVVADFGGMFNEDFKAGVVDLIKKDYSGEVLKYFEPLNNGKLDEMGTAGVLIKDVSRMVGLAAGGTIAGGPLGGAISAGVGEVGNQIEKYYQENGDSAVLGNVTIQGEDGKQYASIYASGQSSSDFASRFSYICNYFNNSSIEFNEALGDVLERTGETAFDMAGNFMVGLVKFGEGIIDETASVAGMIIPSIRDDVEDFVKQDFTGSTVGNFFDSITPNSYLNDNEIGQLVEGVCQGIGQLAPAFALTIATGGAAAPSTLVSAINLTTLGVSAAGNSMESALSDPDCKSYESAFCFSLASGASEVAIEALSGGLSVYGPGIIGALDKSLVGSAFGEGLEEVCSGLLEPVLQKIYKEEDLKEVYSSTEFWQGIVDQFAVGFATALVAEGINSRIGNYSKSTDVQQTPNVIEENITTGTEIQSQDITNGVPVGFDETDIKEYDYFTNNIDEYNKFISDLNESQYQNASQYQLEYEGFPEDIQSIETKIGSLKEDIQQASIDFTSAQNQTEYVNMQQKYDPNYSARETAEALMKKGEILEDVASNKIGFDTSTDTGKKGQGKYGELRTAKEFNDAGWTEIARSPMDLADSSLPINGIDNVFEKTTIVDGQEKTQYLIVDSKSGKSASLKTLADGTRQLSTSWWIDRLPDAVGSKKAMEIYRSYIADPSSVLGVVSHTTPHTDTRFSIVNSDGYVTTRGKKGESIDSVLTRYEKKTTSNNTKK